MSCEASSDVFRQVSCNEPECHQRQRLQREARRQRRRLRRSLTALAKGQHQQPERLCNAVPHPVDARKEPVETAVEKALQAVQVTLARLVEAQSGPAPFAPKKTGLAAGAGGRHKRKEKERNPPKVESEGKEDKGSSHDEKVTEKRLKRTDDNVHVVLPQAVTAAVVSASSLVNAALAL